MYFDFDDYRPDITPVGRVISWREGVLLSIIAHLVGVIVVLAWPRLFPYDPSAARRVPIALPQDQEAPRFVFVQPRVDTTAVKPPNLSEASDKNRQARALEKAEKPENPLPFSKGNSPNRVEDDRQPNEVARGSGPTPDPGQEAQAQSQPQSQTRVPESQSALLLPNSHDGTAPQRAAGGLLGDALRNLQRTMQSEQFSNPQGGAGNFGPGIQFDTKGVEFGPWLRRFVEQVKRNWEPLIPSAATYMKGHVVVTFNIHKDGTITELAVASPCPIDGFNNAAYGAMRASNPTYPLPPEYPADQAFFTVTFFYNEQPPQ